MAPFTSTAPLRLLMLSRYTPSTSTVFIGKSFYFKYSEGDELIFYFIPALKNGKQGFWDVVTEQFYPLQQAAAAANKVNNSVIEQMYIICEEALENEDTGKENC